MDKFFWILLTAWGVFLVLIGTFGGEQGLTVAGNAGAISMIALFFLGLWKSFE